MALNSFNRNYGMSANSREFWGGNNGFVTIVVALPANTEIGVTTVTQDGTDTAQSALSAAQYNQFKIAEILGQRAVIVATSILSTTADPTVGGFGTVGGNVLAYGSFGTPAANSFAVTFLIERADVLDTQASKPGSAYPQSVNPTLDIATVISTAGFFLQKDSVTPSVASAGVAVKVYDALPPILS